MRRVLEHCDGLHFHALCEQDSSALENVLKNFEEKFGSYIPKMKWINFGGGHHITRKGYDTQDSYSSSKTLKRSMR